MDIRYPQKSWIINQNIWELAWIQDKEQSEKIVGTNNKNLEEYKQHYNNWCKKWI
jgi:hypothetical protein